MGVWSVVVHVGMAVAAGVDHLARAQDRASVVALGVATPWRTRWELLAHIFGEGQATAGASGAVCTTHAIRLIFGGIRSCTEEVRVIFNLG